MDELTAWLASKAGIENTVAEQTIGIILGYLRNEGPTDKVQVLIDKIPGAEAAISASENGSGLARLMGGGLMAVGTRLMGLGLGVSDIQNIARELFRFGRDKIGEDQIFYLNQRGIDSEKAVALIINGYAREVLNQLPMEFAVEAQKLLSITLEGSVG